MRSGRRKFATYTIIVAVALVLLFVGGNIITNSSQDLSLQLGLHLFVIRLVVAIGTCLPELAFALRASRTRHDELGLGNIFGNVLADSMLTIGVIALIQPIKPNQPLIALATGLFMLFSGALVAFLSRKNELTYKHGLLLTLCYVRFIALQYALEITGPMMLVSLSSQFHHAISCNASICYCEKRYSITPVQGCRVVIYMTL